MVHRPNKRTKLEKKLKQSTELCVMNYDKERHWRLHETTIENQRIDVYVPCGSFILFLFLYEIILLELIELKCEHKHQ